MGTVHIILIIVGIVLLVINILMIIKFFQMAKNIERLTRLYVDGSKELFKSGIVKYYKLPLEELNNNAGL